METIKFETVAHLYLPFDYTIGEGKEIYKVTGISQDEGMWYYESKETSDWWNVNLGKPYLRKLDSMTDEELNELLEFGLQKILL